MPRNYKVKKYNGYEVIEYRAVKRGPDDWAERFGRHYPMITPADQLTLANAKPAVAGGGGMGGGLPGTFARTGIGAGNDGEIRNADPGDIDLTNIHRQPVARRGNINKNKAREVGREVWRITNDVNLKLFPQGINPLTVRHFVEGSDIICDEIDFWKIGTRFLLHQYARRFKVDIISANAPFMGTVISFWPHDGASIEDVFGITYEHACELEAACDQGSPGARREVTKRMFAGLVSERLGYHPGALEALQERMIDTGIISIFGPTPSFAANFLAIRVCLYLLRNSEVHWDIADLPRAPEFIHLDAATLSFTPVRGRSVQ